MDVFCEMSTVELAKTLLMIFYIYAVGAPLSPDVASMEQLWCEVSMGESLAHFPLGNPLSLYFSAGAALSCNLGVTVALVFCGTFPRASPAAARWRYESKPTHATILLLHMWPRYHLEPQICA